MGLKALGGFGVFGEEKDEYEVGEVSVPKSTLGKFPRERMGRRRKFFFTLLRN